jgi:hypothetical protein
MVDSRNKREQNSDRERAQGTRTPSERGDGDTTELREANENIRKAQGDDAMDTPVDPRKTGNRPRFDRDR